MIKQYRKKPIVVEAAQINEETAPEIMKWSKSNVIPHFTHNWIVFTREGSLTARPGEWIIKGIEGEFYPCGDEIFKATYEEVNE